MTKTILKVPDISCAHCEKTITGALKGQPGVRSVRVDIDAKTVNLDYDERAIGLDRINGLLDDEGYPVQSSSAS